MRAHPGPNPQRLRSCSRSGAIAFAAATTVLIALVGPANAATAEPLVRVSVTGTIENLIVDADVDGDGGPATVESLVEVDGELFDLPDDVAVPAVPTGQNVLVTLAAAAGTSGADALGLVADGAAPTVARVVAVTASGGDRDAAAVLEPTAGVVLGTHTLTVLPVYWASTGPDVALETLANVATDTAAYWSEQSASRITISAGVRGWGLIADPGSCAADSTAFLNAVFAAALEKNPGLAATSLSNHVLVYFPASDCAFAGVGSVLGGRIWVNGAPLVDVVAHEFGHNLGLGHANQLTCTSGSVRVSLSSSCTTAVYGDRADVMGYATTQRSGNLTTALADYLGFAQVTQIPALPASAVTVDLAPLAAVLATRAAKIEVPGGAVYVDFRPAVGRDTRMPAWAGVQVHLRTIDGRGIPTSYLLDLQPARTSPFYAPAMPVGATWAVPGTELTVTVVSVGAAARVRVGLAAAPAPQVDPPTLAAYVTRVYRDLFGREPDPQGLQTWTAALAAGTPRVAVANSITASSEYRRGLINESYVLYLGRTADSAGLEHWLGQMHRGMTIQQMEGGFLASPEYYAKSGSTSAAWVHQLYSHVLKRTPASAEVQYWTTKLAQPGVSRYQVATGFLMSTEHLATVVDRYYVDLLGRGIDPSGKSTWVRKLQSGVRLEAIIGGIVASDEYYGKG